MLQAEDHFWTVDVVGRWNTLRISVNTEPFEEAELEASGKEKFIAVAEVIEEFLCGRASGGDICPKMLKFLNQGWATGG